MKISLGVDFNLKRTIISYFNTDNNKIETLFNEPSIGMISKTGGHSYYGNECNNINSISYNYDFVPSFLNEQAENIINYLRYAFSIALSKIKENDIEIEYVVFSDSKKTREIKKNIFPKLVLELTKYQKAFSKTNLIFSKRSELLKLSLIRALNEEHLIEEERFLLLDLSNFIYQADVFDYKSGQPIPKRVSFTLNTEFDGMGINGFVEKMIESMLKRDDFPENKRFFESGIIRDHLIQKIQKLISEKPLTFYEKEKESIYLVINNKEVKIDIRSIDYNYAVSETIYLNKSLRLFLKRLKEIVKSKNCKVITYGLLEKNVDVKALIYSIFGENYVSKDKVLSYDNNLGLNHVSDGAAFQTTLRYKGLSPKITYTNNYNNKTFKLLYGNEELILGRSINDRPVYFYYRDFNIPLLYKNESRIIFKINGKDIDLTEKLYDESGLIYSGKLEKFGEGFMANMKIGIYDDDRKFLVLDFTSQQNNYKQSIELEVL